MESAIGYVHQNGGTLDINSEVGLGTTVRIILNTKNNSPLWYPDKILLSKNLVIIDDDNSVHEFWREKFSYSSINIINFFKPTDFIAWHKNLVDDSQYVFFIDYDYNTEITGIDLIEKIINTENIYLITSNYHEFKIQNFAIKHNIKLIPKSVLSEILLIQECSSPV